MKNGDYYTADVVRFSFCPERNELEAMIHYSWYDYYENEIIVRDGEIEYACDLIKKMSIGKFFYKDVASQPELVGFHVLNKRKYLIVCMDVYFDDGPRKSKRRLDYYVDYERLQQKMALEGKS